MKRRLFVLFATLALLVPAALPTQAQSWGNCVQFYTVQPGDTLARIARIYGTTVSYLASINGIANPNRIFRWQTLCIQIYVPPPQNVTYIVQRGDWLTRIAQRFGVSLSALLQANPIMNPNLIFPGQVLIIPIYGYSPYAANAQQYSAPANNPPMNQPPQYVPPSGGGSVLPPNATPEASG